MFMRSLGLLTRQSARLPLGDAWWINEVHMEAREIQMTISFLQFGKQWKINILLLCRLFLLKIHFKA